MDEQHLGEKKGREPDPPEPVKPAPAQPSPADVLMVPGSTGKEAWRGGSGCGPRVRLFMLAIAFLVLVAILTAGFSVLRRAVWVTMEQGQQAVIQCLPFDLPSSQRQRVMKNLERFQAVLEASDDPYPTMGEFMKRVRTSLEDYRLTVEEVEEINLFLEGVIEESGIAVMQLGKKMRNEELGIRNAAHPPQQRRSLRGQPLTKSPNQSRTHVSWGRRGGNSSFLIPNSSFLIPHSSFI